MAQAENIHQLTPMLYVSDCVGSAKFFEQVLGFTVIFQSEDFALLRCGGASVRIVEEKGRKKVNSEDARTTVYIEVYNVDALYLEREIALATLPTDDVVKPVTQPWNQRELLVRMPDGNWIAFGQEL
ncbi:MAG: VOC family protein [Candidatus Kapaibacteriota bacterium]|jgi:catechol-2,3-dioxygenase